MICTKNKQNAQSGNIKIQDEEQYPKSLFSNTFGGFPSNKQKIGGIVNVSCPP